MAITLFQHNADAYVSALNMLGETGKAAIIHPTGTGKSFISGFVCHSDSVFGQSKMSCLTQYSVRNALWRSHSVWDSKFDEVVREYMEKVLRRVVQI